MASQSENYLTMLQDAVAKETEEFGFPGMTVYVDLGRTNIRGTVAAGLADPRTGLQLTGHEPSRIASMTKTYTAAAILRLVETGRVALDGGAASYLTNDTVALLRSGGYQPAAMTVRQLLQHTSGLAEHAGEAYQEYIMQHPQHRWTRREQVQWALDHATPIGSPGEKFTYSDTGYVLLGEMIEHQTQLPQAEAFRTLLRYDDRGLHHTWFELLEPAPSDLPAMAHQFLGDFDAMNIHPSFDLWGGGGLVATAEDTAIFLRALFDGQVFDHASTLSTMLSIPATNGELSYALGIFRLEVATGEDSKGKTVFWGHTGHFGTAFWYCPAEGIAYAADRHQAIAPEQNYDPHSLVSTAVRIYKLAQKQEKQLE